MTPDKRARDERTAAMAGTLAAAAMIAQQVAGKAARDALFLTHFDVDKLPYMMVATALGSVVAMSASVRLLSRFGPARVVPVAFAVSALMFLGLGAMAGAAPATAAVLLYLHIGALGAVLISGFWSGINERFDPRAARRTIGRIAVGGSLGGLVGGIAALASASVIELPALLLALGAVNALCVPLVRRAARRPRSHRTTGDAPVAIRSKRQPSSLRGGATAVRADPYLRSVAALVFLAATSEALVDWVFKAQAQAVFGDGPALLRFFAIFYSAIGLLTFAVQALLGRRVLERLGWLPAVAALPAGILTAGAGALAFPSLVTVAIARGTDSVLRSSLYRSGYELLFVPIAPGAKRAAKALLDVGFERAGNAIGGLLVTCCIAVGVSHPPALLLVAAALALVALLLCFRLQSGYTGALEASMVNRALEIELSGLTHRDGIPSAALLTLGEIDLSAFSEEEEDDDEDDVVIEAPPGTDPVVSRLVELRSGDASRVRDALNAGPLPPELASHAVSLMAWDPVAADAIRALQPLADAITGTLLDVLLDPSTEFAVRRRVPRVLAYATKQRAIDGLVSGLRDTRFEVRAQCGRALRRATRHHDHLAVSRDAILDAVAQEVSVDTAVWQSHRLLDDELDALATVREEPTPFADAIRLRSERALQHVFLMLSLVFPEDALLTAYRSLHTDDPSLRGTALEYLESVLPARVHRGLIPYVEDRPPSPAPEQPREDVLRALLRSHRSVHLRAGDLGLNDTPGVDEAREDS